MLRVVKQQDSSLWNPHPWNALLWTSGERENYPSALCIGGEVEGEERCDTEATLITNSLFKKKKKTVPFESFVGRELI